MKGPFKMKGFSGYVNQPIAEDKKPVTEDTDIDLSDKAAVDEWNKNIQKINKDLRSSYYRQKKAYSDSTASYESAIGAFDAIQGSHIGEEKASKVRDIFVKSRDANIARGIYIPNYALGEVEYPVVPSKHRFYPLISSKSTTHKQHTVPGGSGEVTREMITKTLKPTKKPVKPKYKKELKHVPALETIKLETQTIKQIPTEPVKLELVTPKPLKPKLKSLSKGKNKKKPWWKKIKIKLPTIKKRVGRRIKTKNLVTGGFNITRRPPRRGY